MQGYIETEADVQRKQVAQLVTRAVDQLDKVTGVLYVTDLKAQLRHGELDTALASLQALYKAATNYKGLDAHAEELSIAANFVRQARNIQAGRRGSEDS